LGTEIPVVDAALHTNEKQPVKVVQVAEKILGSLESKLVALLGLSFKPGTDDMRNAVSVKIIEELVRKGAKVVAYDPRAMANARKILDGKIQISPSAQDCINGADCCIIVTEWDEFKTMQPGDFISRMRKPLVIDGRRIFDADIFSREILYVGIGLGMKNQGHFRPSPANGYAAETQQSRKGPKND
jgi:UDPglucose 6-dehydrogenase